MKPVFIHAVLLSLLCAAAPATATLELARPPGFKELDDAELAALKKSADGVAKGIADVKSIGG